MCLEQLCAMGGWIIFVIQAHYGLGRHQDTIEAMDMMMFSKVGFWQSIISATGAIALLKISIALNLLRLSQSRWYVWSLWASIGEDLRYFCSCLLAPFSCLLTIVRLCLRLLLHGHDDLLPPLQTNGSTLGQTDQACDVLPD